MLSIPRRPAPAGAAPVVVPPDPYHGPALVSVDTDAGPLWFRADDGVMRPYAESRGTWDPDVGGVLTRVVRPGMTFVDVGANVGYFSRLVGTRCAPGVVHAFEPHPELVGVLRMNLWGSVPQARVWPCALGDGHGTVVLQSAEHNVGDTRAFMPGEAPAEMVAAVATLDELLHERVDVVKIDVQGFELEVFRGMQRVIAENPEIVITLEFWPGGLRDRQEDPRAVLAQYASSGLALHLIKSGVPVRASNDEIMRFCDSAGPTGQANLVLMRG